MNITPKIVPPLDPKFVPAVLWNRAYRELAEKSEGTHPLSIALERPDGTVSVVETRVLAHVADNIALNQKYVERLIKFLLWQRGGYKIIIGGDDAIAEMIREIYSANGERAFDYGFIGEKIYGRPLQIETLQIVKMPKSHETSVPLGRHLEGYRIGFDLGGSDRKCAAVANGEVVFSEEIAWDPYFESDPQYHYDGINDTLKRAAAHLPRVDAIGGSAAGVYVNNEVRAASLFRGVSPEDFEARIKRIFFDLKKEWNDTPFEVVNDGEVTALAGSMSMNENAVLGVSMGTSVAGGYVDANGNILPWLNELAFAPVDYRDASEGAPADEWSGDIGCAVQYFCQQGVARLAPLAGLHFPSEMKFPEQLVEVQKLMAANDDRARKIYETIGVCFGYTIAHYADFYDIRNLLILGRVTSGQGGEIIISEAERVLAAEFPELAGKIKLRTPNEQDKRHGQAVAAASLPALR